MRKSTKLTLSIQKQVIDSAKEYAKSQGRSPSKYIEEYLKSVSIGYEQTGEHKLNPIVPIVALHFLDMTD